MNISVRVLDGSCFRNLYEDGRPNTHLSLRSSVFARLIEIGLRFRRSPFSKNPSNIYLVKLDIYYIVLLWPKERMKNIIGG
jgi:hypothetical protein